MLGKMMAEVFERDGGQRWQVETSCLSPRDELRRALETMAYRAVSGNHIARASGECIKMWPGRSRVVRRLRRLSLDIRCEHTALL